MRSVTVLQISCVNSDARPWQVGAEKSVVKPEATGALHYVALVGPIERGGSTA